MLLEAHTGTIIWTLITFAVVLVVLKQSRLMLRTRVHWATMTR